MGTIVNDTRPIQASVGSRDGPGGSSDEIDGPLGAGGRDPRAGDGRRRRRRARGDALPEGNIVEVRIEGNVSVATEQVRDKLLSRPGHPLDQRQVEADLKTLIATKWFSDVTPYYEPDPKGKGYILTFSVKEMPVLTHVEFLGRSKIKLKDVEETTGLKKGTRADAAQNRLAAGQIQRLYANAATTWPRSTSSRGQPRRHPRRLPDLRRALAQDQPDRVRRQHLRHRRHPPHQDHERDHAPGPPRPLHSRQPRGGCPQAHRILPGPGFPRGRGDAGDPDRHSLGDTHLTFVISEGTRYSVRDIKFEGNLKLSEAKLREGLLMHSGKPILDALKEADRKSLLAKYYEIGCIDTQILPEPRYTDQPGVVDLLYRIEEGEPYLLGELIVRGNERTKDKVIRREALMAGLLPGEVLNMNRIDIFEAQLGNTQYFVNAPDQGKPLDIKVINRRPGDKPYGESIMIDLNEVTQTRMQSPAPGPIVPAPAPSAPPSDGPALGGPGGLTPFGTGGRRPPRHVAADRGPEHPAGRRVPPPPVVVGPGSPQPNPTPPLGAGEPAGDGAEPPRLEHDRRRPRPPGSLPQPLVR